MTSRDAGPHREAASPDSSSGTVHRSIAPVEKPEVTVKLHERVTSSLNLIPLPGMRLGEEDAILLTGSPRSGTTWVGQILAAADRFCLATEPLSLKMPGVQRAGFTWNTWVDPEEPWPQGERILRRYFRGRGLTVKMLHRNGRSALSCRGLVIKSVRANRLLPWIVRRFHLRGIVYLTRHPCAVVSSQVGHLHDRDPCWPDNLHYLERRLPHLVSFAHGLRGEEEHRALTWALDQHVPLTAPGPVPWIHTSYERLVIDGERELQRIFSALGLEITPGARRKLSENSWQVRHLSVDHSRASLEERLGVWRRRLSPNQVESIISICEACDVRLYGDDVLPRDG